MTTTRTCALAALLLASCVASPEGVPGAGSADGGPDATLDPAATTRPITLQTAIGAEFVSADQGGGGALLADRATASTWETFTLHDLNGGDLESGDLVTLETANGHFVCAENGGGGEVDATRTSARDWETFRIDKVGGTGAIHDGDQIALATKLTDRYVSADQGGGGALTADRTTVSGWEAFVLGSGGGGDPPGWHLVWSDEFDGPAGPIDGAKWGFDTGNNGWGNGELEDYTDRTDNVRLDGHGHLEIVARAESFGGSAYTSGRINSAGRFSQAYGRFEARIRMPQGRGIWPAFWSLGDNIGDVGWPSCGELDIMEAVADFSINHGSAHGPGYSGGNPLTGIYQLPTGSLADDYHVYAIEWEPDEVRWYVDGVMYERRTPADLPPGTTWVYDHPFFLILDVAVGGNWPGAPDGTTQFPQTMSVDDVRVYSR